MLDNTYQGNYSKMGQHQTASFLDKPLAQWLKPDWEKALYLAIFVLAIVSRFWDLGARAMSFDECTHGLYSYYLYNGTGFTHNPLMHGPFLFHANALIFFLFGDNDYTVRIVPALFGVFMVMSPLLLRRWLGRLGALVCALLLLISPSFLYYSRYIRNEIYITVWMMLLTAALFHFLEKRQDAAPRIGWFYLGAATLMLSLATKENAYFFGFIGLVFIVESILWERVSQRNHAWLYVGAAVLSALLLFTSHLLARAPAGGGDPAIATNSALKLLHALITVAGGTLPAVLLSATLIQARHPLPSRVEEALRSLSRRHWLIAVTIMFVIYALLFTTFFTRPAGLVSGIFGSLSYWLAQQEVQRGSQPLYYYPLLLLTYEFVPLLFGLMGMLYYLLRRPFPQSEPQPPPESGPEEEHPRAAPPSASTSPLLPLFVAFLILWALTSLFLYSWAGEKMPWMVVHQALPILLLAGKFIGDLLAGVDWRAVVRRGGVWLALLLPLTLFGLYSLTRPQQMGHWLAILFVVLLLLLLTGLGFRRLGARYSLVVISATVLAFLSLFTVRFAWMAAYINYDYATELLVYAHGGADVKPTMDEIAAISQRTVGDKTIEVAYDQEAAWPLEWYMREYPNHKFYGTEPTRERLDAPIVIASIDIDAQVQPYLGDRYYRFKRRQLWWPNQQYMDLTWERIRDILTSPEKRQALWKILYYREYPRTLDDWYHVDYMYVYIRKDIAQQIWDLGAAPPGALELPPDPYTEAHLDLNVASTWGEVGTEPGQFNHPRGVALGPEGKVYVVDSDNHRVQVFDAEGAFLRTWGSQCNLAEGYGCADPDGDGPLAYGDGQFQEPWGIAVAADGRVYVADTWNHRIQVFAADGTFLAKWGSYGQTDDAVTHLYGPRDVAVDATGRVLVTDTGNKRVLVYDAEGNLLHHWGGAGAGPGEFEEPIGIALDAGGRVYVADTWNRRVQVFGSDFAYLGQWPVEGWYGESVVNKPYLAVDSQGKVYLTDPEGYRVAVFSSEGELLATFGRYGFEEGAFSLPTGIAVDDGGFVYLADTTGQRVIKFEPLP
jgi:uncharacterized protein (TIGR03663 family)